MIKYLSEIKVAAPLEHDHPNQLDELISLRLKSTLEEVEKRYKDNLDHHISATSTILKIHDNMISATNELIKTIHVHHENQIQRLKKEILHADAMDMVMQEVLMKVVQSAQQFVDTPNHIFDEILIILDETFNHLKAQDLTTNAYDFLSNKINKTFQWVFDW